MCSHTKGPPACFITFKLLDFLLVCPKISRAFKNLFFTFDSGIY